MKLFLRRDAVVLIVYLFLALGLTYPLITHFATHVPGRGIDDPALAWNVWWFKFSVFDLGVSPLYTDYLYFPLGVNLAANTSTFLNGLIALPLQFLFGTIIAQNLVVYFALVIGGYGAYLLAREVLSRRNAESDFAAALAGAFYAFGAWHINYVAAGHFMLLSNEWLPFFALYLLRMDKGRWRNGARAGLFFAMSAWTELTFIPMIAILTALYVIYHLLLIGRGRTRTNADQNETRSAFVHIKPRSLILNFIALGGIAALGVSPLLINLLGDTLRYGYYIAPGLGRVQVFSAEPISFFIPSFTHPIMGAWANALTNANTSYAFVGYAALILAALGFVFNRASRDARFWFASALFFALVLLGPTLIIAGQNTGVPMPFALVRMIPFVNANRYPVRFNVMLMLALVPLIVLGAARLAQTRRAFLGALLALLAFEQLALPIPLTDLRAPMIFETIRREPGDFAVMDLPLGWRDSVAILGKIDYTAQFLQTIHEKRLIGGLVSRHPAWKFQYFLELSVLNSLIALENGQEIDDARRARDRELASEVLRFFNVRYIAATRALTDARVLAYVHDVFPVEEVYRDDARSVYRVAPQVAPERIDVGAETARLYFDDAWGRAQSSAEGPAYRWATRGDSRIWLPLEHREQTITFRLRGAHARQALTLRVNNRSVAEIMLRDVWDNYAVPIPAEVLRDRLNDFVFVTETVPLGAARQDDYAIGDTGVAAPVDVAVTGAGFDAGRFREIFVAGKNVIESRRGYHLVAINPQTGAVEHVASFDTFADSRESARLAQFIAALPRGEIVTGVAVDDVSQNLQPSAIDALHSIGVESDLRWQFRAGHAFIGVKGAQAGQALESVDGRFPANVAVGKNVAGDRVAFALAEIKIDH
jgi:hypothetical protein